MKVEFRRASTKDAARAVLEMIYHETGLEVADDSETGRIITAGLDGIRRAAILEEREAIANAPLREPTGPMDPGLVRDCRANPEMALRVQARELRRAWAAEVRRRPPP